MYKQLTDKDYRKFLKLPDSYQVDGILCHGSMRKKKHKKELSETINKLGLTAKYDVIYESGFFENITVLEINGKRIWFDSSYGGAYLCEMLHVGCLLGSKKNILIGSCGGLSLEGNAGDIIVPTASYGNESTTRMYQPDNEEFQYSSDKIQSEDIRKSIRPAFRVISGKIMTCQAAMMESWDDILRWSNEGYAGVEMESSTFFAVSSYFNVPASALLLIADNLIRKESLLSEGFENLKDKLNQSKFETFRVAFEQLLAS